MDPYIVEQGRDSISVKLIPLDNTFEFKGTSIPENADEFYRPIVEWVKNYAKEPNSKSISRVPRCQERKTSRLRVISISSKVSSVFM